MEMGQVNLHHVFCGFVKVNSAIKEFIFNLGKMGNNTHFSQIK